MTYALGRGLTADGHAGRAHDCARCGRGATTGSRRWFLASSAACRSRCGSKAPAASAATCGPARLNRARNELRGVASHVHHQDVAVPSNGSARLGATLALPLLDAMVPALTRDGADRRGTRRGASARSSCRWASARATGRRRRPAPSFEFSPDPEADRAVPRSRRRGVEHRSAAAGHPRGQHRHLAHGQRAEAHRGRGLRRRHLARSDHRQADRAATRSSRRSRSAPRTSPATSGACDVGYSCAYMNTISWKSPTHADADGDQPARRLRADVRPARAPSKSACGGCSRTAASSTR